MAAQTIDCATACTVTLQLEAAPPDEGRISDITQAFLLMLVVVLTVWGGRQLYNVFNTSPHDGN